MQDSDRKAYSDELRALIDNPSAGLLLDAEVDYDSDGNEMPRRHGAAFHLTSGKYRRYFVTLWELFDHPAALHRCVAMIVALASQISRLYQFNTVVTCTHTARELLHHVQPLLEARLGHELLVSELGHYPWAIAGDLEPYAFQSHSVLIFTDVMASGTLARQMAARVIRNGGEVAAILSVVLCMSEAELKEAMDENGQNWVELDHGVLAHPTKVPLYALTEKPLKSLEDRQFDPAAVRRIDFVHVFPEFTPPTHQHAVECCVPDSAAMFRQLRDAQALTYGFFVDNGRHFSLGVRIGRLLERVGDELWSQIEPAIRSHIQAGALLVSTYKKDDLQFLEFLDQRIRTSIHSYAHPIPVPTRVVLKRQLGDSPHLHHALFRHTVTVRGRDLILVRANATTSEELRSLAALLAGEKVNSITVLCLINRMGVYTASFVRRIGRLITGSLKEATSEITPAGFFFKAVYNFNDLRTDDLACMQERVTLTLDKFARATDVAHFKALTEQYSRAVRARSPHTHSFEVGSGGEYDTLVAGGFARDGQAIPLSEAIALVTEDISHHRTHRFIELVRLAQRPEIFLQLAGIAMVDIDYLRLSGQLRVMRESFHERVAALRTGRLAAERSDATSGEDPSDDLSVLINQHLDMEANLLFSAGLLAHFDKTENAASVIVREVLFAGIEPEVWHTHPHNLRYHFRDIRNYWLTVFLLHAEHPDLYAQSNAVAVRREVVGELRLLMERLLTDLPASASSGEDDLVILRNRIRETMNLLLAELRAHAHHTWQQRIRYLQLHALRDPDRHSALWTALTAAESELDDFIRNPDDVAIQKRLPRRIREAFNSALTLREVAEVARRLAFYPSHQVTDKLQPLFGDRNAPESFHRTAAQLIEYMGLCEKKLPSTKDDLRKFKDLVWLTGQAVFGDKSELREVLLWFCVPMRATIIEALSIADSSLLHMGLSNVWSNEINRQTELQASEASEFYVLIEPQLLLQVLGNLFFNVHHNISKLPKSTTTYADHVRLRLEEVSGRLPDPEAQEAQFFSLTVEADGAAYRDNLKRRMRRHSTLEDQDARLREFGGHIDIDNGPSGSGSRATLKLLSRQNYAHYYQDRKSNRSAS
jgi:hypothetical protein